MIQTKEMRKILILGILCTIMASGCKKTCYECFYIAYPAGNTYWVCGDDDQAREFKDILIQSGYECVETDR